MSFAVCPAVCPLPKLLSEGSVSRAEERLLQQGRATSSLRRRVVFPDSTALEATMLALSWVSI